MPSAAPTRQDFVRKGFGQMLVMAVIVATMLLAPVAGLLALLCHLAFGLAWRSFFTFGGTLNPVEGILAWWVIVFAPSLAYSAYAMPWGQK